MQENNPASHQPVDPRRDSSDDEQVIATRVHSHFEQLISQDIQFGKDNKNAYVGTGFTFDFTQFFQFAKKLQLQPDETPRSIYKEIAGEGIAWIILLYSVLNASFITLWVLSSKINKFLALSWRFIFQFLLMVPFVLYERRTISTQDLHKYQLSHIFNVEYLKKMYVYSLSAALWYGLILTAAQWTYISHALYLGSLSNFFASLFRHRKGNLHKYEIGGQATVALGILLVLMDTCLSGSNRIGESELGNKIKYDVSSSRGQQFLADIIALLTSLMIAKITSLTAGTPSIFPPYLSMMILNGMNAINMLGMGYFFNGVTFDFSAKWGFFSVISDYQFAMFLYGCLVLCLGLIVSFVIIGRMFPNYVIPSIAYFFEPGISTLLLEFTKIQVLPGWFSLTGYAVMSPGMMLIAIGQWVGIRRKEKQRLLSNSQIELSDMDGNCPPRNKVENKNESLVQQKGDS